MDEMVLPKKVLLVDDDPSIAEGLEGPLRKHGINLVRALDVETALFTFNQQIIEVAIVELEFASLPGLALVQKFREHKHKDRRQIGIIVAAGQQKKATDASLAGEIGDLEFATKPLNIIKLLPLLGRAGLRRRALAELEEVRTVCYDLVKKGSGHLQAAIDYLKPRLAKLPPKHGTSLMLGLQEEANQLDEALTLCDQVLAKSADDLATLNIKGRLLLKLGQVDRAKEALEKADKLAPHNIERVKAMADLYLKLKDPKASIDKMREVIALSPEQPDLKFEMFRQLEDYGFAEHSIKFCRETTPPAEVVRFYNNKGVVLSKTGSPGEAVGEYQAALKFYPAFRENYRVFFNIALAEASQRQPASRERAIAALKRCLELNPNFEKAQVLLASLQKSGGKAAG